jgi:Mannosyltransferase (PIG-V)
VSAGQRVRLPKRTVRRELRLPRAGNPAPEIFLWTRAAIWAAALFALFVFVPNRHPRAGRWDDPSLTHDLGAVTDVWARWDSVWFLRIAEHGYDAASGAASAFYPLYPAAVGLLGRALFGHYVLAGIVVSLAAALGSFLLLHRLAEERLGADGARRAVLYLAVFPFALFLQAVYSESLYLLLTLAAFALAERGRFLAAGGAAGLAMLTRPVGIALLPALALLAWRKRERPHALAPLVLGPAIFAAYPLYLWRAEGDAWAFVHAQRTWSRHLSPAGPLGGVWDGLRAGWAGIEQLASGSHTHVYWTAVRDTDPIRAATINLESLTFLALFLLLTVVAWRRFGAPYGLFAALSLAIPLSVPSERWPLLSLPRFGLTVFPFFLALAALGGRPRLHTAVVAVSSLLLGVATVQWALWQWVA